MKWFKKLLNQPDPQVELKKKILGISLGAFSASDEDFKHVAVVQLHVPYNFITKAVVTEGLDYVYSSARNLKKYEQFKGITSAHLLATATFIHFYKFALMYKAGYSNAKHALTEVCGISDSEINLFLNGSDTRLNLFLGFNFDLDEYTKPE
ncbi:MAG TPA: hypothetical protein DD666_09930 [Advenella kashmirensis]|uniref:Uncharacterized protein n=1 Tax=Advenella kashmirensis TaxID=310575 RepID=A0A356LGL7_9BURK|nr:hypothetical protein [Advenella kashmirensis]